MDVIKVLSEDNARITAIGLELRAALESLFQAGAVPTELLKQTTLALEHSENLGKVDDF